MAGPVDSAGSSDSPPVTPPTDTDLGAAADGVTLTSHSSASVEQRAAIEAFGISTRDLRSLSIGEVLMLVQRCTQSTEEQIRDIAGRIQGRAAQASTISSEIQALTALAHEGRSRGGDGLRMSGAASGDATQTADVRGARAILDQFQPGPDAPEEARTRYAQLREQVDGGDDHILSQEEITNLIQQKREELTQLNSGNEMEMMQLQSLTQQRSQYFTMGTQLIAAFGEVGKSITGNIGR